jgi:hypothetical protein
VTLAYDDQEVKSVPLGEKIGEERSNAPTIFISYIRGDLEAARRLYSQITDLGGDVWLDERRLLCGDQWSDDVRSSIRNRIDLLLPVMSANTEREDEGYVFREWREAIERSRSIPARRFIIPVIVDEHPGQPGSYRQIPEEFMRFHIGYAPGGKLDSALREMLTEEIREIRRRSGVA